MENWREYLKEGQLPIWSQINKIMSVVANMKLQTGPPGQRQMRPEWEKVLGALDAIALNVSGASALEKILYPAYRQSISDRQKMSYDELDKLETTAEDNAVVALWKLAEQLTSWQSSIPKDLIDNFLEANASIQQAGVQKAQPVGQFRADTLGRPSE